MDKNQGLTYLFDNFGRYYEPNIGGYFNSIEFWKRLLEYVFFLENEPSLRHTL